MTDAEFELIIQNKYELLPEYLFTRPDPAQTARAKRTRVEIKNETMSGRLLDKSFCSVVVEEKQCPICNEMVPAPVLDKHAEQCVDLQNGRKCKRLCSKFFPASEIEEHEHQCDPSVDVRREEFKKLLALLAVPGQAYKAEAVVAETYDTRITKTAEIYQEAIDDWRKRAQPQE